MPAPADRRRARVRAAAVLAAALVASNGLAACRDGGDEAGDAQQLCAALADRGRYAAVFEGFDPTDTERAIDQLRTARVELGELRAAAPRELHDEFDAEIEGVELLIDTLEQVGPGDAAAAVTALRGIEGELAATEEAARALDAWAARNCAAT